MNTSSLQQNHLASEENAYMDQTTPHSDTDIAILAGQFLGNLAAHNYSARSVDDYRYALKNFTGFVQARGKTAALAIKPQDIADYRLSLVERRLKQNSLYVYLRVVRMFFRYLVEQDCLFVNPAADMEMPGPDRKLQPVPTEEEVAMLLASPDTSSPAGIRDRAMLETLYSTATRREELVGMDVKDVDFAACTIRIKGKGGHERVVPLGKGAMEWLKRYLSEARDTLAHGRPEEPWLWFSNYGRRLSGQVLITIIKGYARACCGIKTHITTHSLRRACATHMLQRGANPLEIQMLLGHADLTHLRHYLRLSIHDLKAAHEKTRLGE